MPEEGGEIMELGRLDPSIVEPGRSPWNRIMLLFDWMEKANFPYFISPLRDFVAAVVASPFFEDRYVYPSELCLTIFKTGHPVEFSDRTLHPRVVVSPKIDRKIVIWYYPGGGAADPVGKWLCDPVEGIEVIRKCFADTDSDTPTE